MEEQPLVRHRSIHTSSGSGESDKEVGVTEVSSPLSPGQPDVSNQPHHNGNAFPSDEVSSLHISYRESSTRNSTHICLLFLAQNFMPTNIFDTFT